jgi:hypothetical protein
MLLPSVFIVVNEKPGRLARTGFPVLALAAFIKRPQAEFKSAQLQTYTAGTAASIRR